MSSTQYAGFWLRFVAIIIDSIVIGIVQTIIIIPILGAFGISVAAAGMDPGAMTEEEALGMFATLMGTLGTSFLISQVIYFLYFTIMEASKFQATLGKMALGLKVTDLNGQPLDFPRALLRNLGKIVSQAILLIGFIMAGLTEKKQALHDMFASALVVKK
jgi:uncharacterized RDD family membrane protein YckC